MTRTLLDLTPAQLHDVFAEWNEPPFRVKQLLQWIYPKAATEFDEMSNLSKLLRTKLAEAFVLRSATVVEESVSADETCKLLLEFPDGARVETVLIPGRNRRTVCVSTQVGCAMGCAFCASGIDGLGRNLTAGEILEQVLRFHSPQTPVTNVVFMGSGEPLANYDATLQAVRCLIDPDRLDLSARKITLSTVGLVDGIRRLAAEDIPLTLAISLHAPNDELRRELLPIAANACTIEELLDAAGEFYDARHREITLEYTLLEGVNDSNLHADQLANLAHSVRCNVNLLAYNVVEELDFHRPNAVRFQAFAARLTQRGVNVNIRNSRGETADAACGQLRRREDQ